MSDPTDTEVLAANLLTELERAYEKLKEADVQTIKRLDAAGVRRTWGIDGHVLVQVVECIRLARSLADVKQKYDTGSFYVKSNHVLRAENRELRKQVDDLKATTRTLCGLLDLAEPALGSAANPHPVLKEHERLEQ